MVFFSSSSEKLSIARAFLTSKRYREAIKNEFRAPQTEEDLTGSIALGIKGLCRAQDFSISADGGVCRHFSPITGWAPSYPDTTGYIVPIFLEHAAARVDAELRGRAVRMLDWLISIQLPGGGFQGGVIGQTPCVPVTFNTGQILLGLAAGVRHVGDTYRLALRAAAHWLVTGMDKDGCWRKYPSPFAHAGEKAYETHVAWGLLEAARLEDSDQWACAAERNLRWALTNQLPNGWVDNCCLLDAKQPFTHTLGYFLRGLVEGHKILGHDWLLQRAMQTAIPLSLAVRDDGFLAGRFDRNWRSTVSYSCLTGSAQIAHSFLLRHFITGDTTLRDKAILLNKYVRSKVRDQRNLNIVGAVKGSNPIWGGYCAHHYPNWATKFFVDSQYSELAIHEPCDVTDLSIGTLAWGQR